MTSAEMRVRLFAIAVTSLPLLALAANSHPWTLSGELLSETSREPIAGHAVVLRKLSHPWWCIFCLGGYRDYATATTDKSGRFEFADAKSGFYEVATRCPPGSTFEFAARVSVGELAGGKHQVVIEHGIEHCTFNR